MLSAEAVAVAVAVAGVAAEAVSEAVAVVDSEGVEEADSEEAEGVAVSGVAAVAAASVVEEVLRISVVGIRFEAVEEMSVPDRFLRVLSDPRLRVSGIAGSAMVGLMAANHSLRASDNDQSILVVD